MAETRKCSIAYACLLFVGGLVVSVVVGGIGLLMLLLWPRSERVTRQSPTGRYVAEGRTRGNHVSVVLTDTATGKSSTVSAENYGAWPFDSKSAEDILWDPQERGFWFFYHLQHEGDSLEDARVFAVVPNGSAHVIAEAGSPGSHISASSPPDLRVPPWAREMAAKLDREVSRPWEELDQQPTPPEVGVPVLPPELPKDPNAAP